LSITTEGPNLKWRESDFNGE